jgi:hypothetical protein
MRLWTLFELMRLSKSELCDLARTITGALPGLPESSPAYQTAIENLRLIRLELARRDFLPFPG